MRPSILGSGGSGVNTAAARADECKKKKLLDMETSPVLQRAKKIVR